MPDLYDGREQSKAKHEIYARYLVPFASKILSTWPTIDVIDGFAGPWKNNDIENLSDTSIGVSLRVLSEVAEKAGHTASNPCIRCIFNEADPNLYQLLKGFIDRSRGEYPQLKLIAFEGKFEKNAAEIDQAADHAFRLLFVDPTGYTGFPPSSLQQFGIGRSQEIIVNMMRSFLERFATGGHQNTLSALTGLVGAERAAKLIANELSVESVERSYLNMLKEDLGFKYAAYSPIHNPDKNQVHFNLAYGTNHPEGLEVLRQAEFKALSEHDRTRYNKKANKDVDDLFAAQADEMELRGPYLRERNEHEGRATAVIRSILIKRGALTFKELSARAQEQLFLKRSEIGTAVVEMTNAGAVKSDWKQLRQQKPRLADLIELLSIV